MDQFHDNNRAPWDPDFYETGSTQPPKNRRGLIAVLLVALILLCGISSALGVANIRLSQHLNQSGGDSDASLSFTNGTGESSQNTEATAESAVSNPGGVTVELNPVPGAADNVPQEGGLSYQEIYAKAIDSVVSISCTLSGGTTSGTGVVLSSDGYLVTNCHVVEGAQTIRVRFTDERVLEAVIVGADAASDLAVLYVNADDLIPAEFGDSAQLRVGDAVAAIGDPLGTEFRGTMTDGIVSAINRDVTVDSRTMTLIQTNAALNSGNSGGPLLNCYGQVIGINTMKISAFTDEAGVEGLGFAIPSTTVKEIVDQLIAQGDVSGRPSLGVTYEDVSAFDQRFYRLPEGALVNRGNSRTGLQSGDVILSINGTRVYSAGDLTNALYSFEVGDQVELIIYRYNTGKQYSVILTLTEASG